MPVAPYPFPLDPLGLALVPPPFFVSTGCIVYLGGGALARVSIGFRGYTGPSCGESVAVFSATLRVGVGAIFTSAMGVSAVGAGAMGRCTTRVVAMYG